MLHRGDAPYRAGRGAGLLKLKPYDDAEAHVIAIRPGQGRLEGRMGSLEVRTQVGRRFSIGSGFSDEDRTDPPPVGSWVTYRFNGLTATGLPRFARFMRRWQDGPPPEPAASKDAGTKAISLNPPSQTKGEGKAVGVDGSPASAYAPCERAHCTMPGACMAPACRATSRPSRNSTSVGMLRMS